MRKTNISNNAHASATRGVKLTDQTIRAGETISWEIRLLRILRVLVGEGILVAPILVLICRLQIRLDLPVVVVDRPLDIDVNLSSRESDKGRGRGGRIRMRIL